MAEFEKPGFQFPDEVEEDAKKGSAIAEKEEKEAELDFEVEVEDDRPEKDRNVEPLPENVKEELYQDELTDYSAKVKNKILQMKKLAHDERREKEQAYREQQEALALAQKVMEENKRLKTLANENEKSILMSITRAVEMELNEAKRAYREAYEAGDTDRIIEAQQKLTEASLKSDKVKNYKPTPLQIETPEVQIPQQAVQAPRPDPAAVAWQSKNTWFGEDDEMTSLALGLHEKLKKEGVAVSSQEYYRRIDETIRKRFPERFETDTTEDKDEETRSTKRPSTVVAPATRSTSPKKIRLTNSQMSIAKKLGLSPEQYAQAVLKMES